MFLIISLIITLSLLVAAFFFDAKGLRPLSDLVNRNDSSMWAIDLVNLVYWVKSFFAQELNHCVIDSLILYPIKSVGKGLKLKEWKIDEAGLAYDRQYTFVFFDKKVDEWKPVTLKQCTELITVEYEIEDGFFVVKYAQGLSFKLPMEVTKAYLDSVSTDNTLEVRLWLLNVKSYDISSVIPQGFIEHFKLPPETKLLYTVDGHQVVQGSPRNLSNTVNGSKYRISKYQDYYPFLILSKGGLRHLNGRLSQSQFSKFKVNEHTFRPNIVVEGDIPPHDEDTWYKFRVNTKADGNQHYFRISIKCGRCTIPNIDLEGDLQMNKQGPVTRILSKYRRTDVADKFHSYFGVYAIHHDTGYTIRAGDSIDVLQRKVNFFDSPFGSY